MINIVLNKIHIQPIDIVDALETYNPAILTPDVCELIAPIMPTDKEVEALTTAQFENEDDLSTADQWILIMSNFVAGFERAKSVAFSYTYEDDCKLLNQEADKFFEVFDFLKKSEDFKTFMTIILAFGNYMNGGNSRGGAYGVSIDIITKLADTKSTDNKLTFIKWLYQWIKEKSKTPDILEPIYKATELMDSLQYIGLTEGVSMLEKKFLEVEKLKKKTEQKKAELMEADKSAEFLGKHYEKMKGLIQVLNDKIAKINTISSEVRKFYCEPVKKDDDPKTELPKFIGYFKTFKNDLKDAAAWYDDMKEKEKKKIAERSKNICRQTLHSFSNGIAQYKRA